MRIQKIELCNFKGFYDACEINLDRNCKNLLVYGENGSGKSSLYQALQLFLESDVRDLRFRDYWNIFTRPDDSKPPVNKGYIRLTLRADGESGERTYEWSPKVRETGVPEILDANKVKGFLDYKSLLETYFLHRHENRVNLFDLLIKTLLKDRINDITGNTFLDDWIKLEAFLDNRMTNATKAKLEQLILDFNQGLIAKLKELQEKASEILSVFEYRITISLSFSGIGYNYADTKRDRAITGQEIILRVDLSARPLVRHHTFLNEAKLSAIALSIYLASLRLMPSPPSVLRLLVLDDVLIGLDMSNRLPVLDILKNFFSDYQIILTTYDRNWFEMIRLRTTGTDWKCIEFYRGQPDDFEIPIFIEKQDLLDKAEEHLNNKDYKACAVYIRTEFERLLKKLALKKKLKVPYVKASKKLSSQDFWDSIKQAKRKDPLTRNKIPMLSDSIITQIETYRKFVLNPLSHSELTNIHERELREAIAKVEKLRTEIQGIL